LKFKNKITGEIQEWDRIYIDSKTMGSSCRKRLYWTTIDFDTNIPLSDKKIKDMLDPHPYPLLVTDWLTEKEYAYAPRTGTEGIITINPKKIDGTSSYADKRVYDVEGYCPTLCASIPGILITEDHKNYRQITPEETEIMMTVPRGYTSHAKNSSRYKMLGNGWCISTVAHLLKNI